MDIDIDLPTTFEPDKIFDIVHASMIENGDIKKHNVGVYFQNVPKDAVSQLAAIPYKEAEKEGYLKIDLLHLAILNIFGSKDEIRGLLKVEPDWNLLKKRAVVEKLFQLGKHYDVVVKLKPKSISDLSDLLALIRPSKRKLLNKYINNKQSVMTELYTKREPSDMRKSHTVPYSMIIVLQLHLIKAGIL